MLPQQEQRVLMAALKTRATLQQAMRLFLDLRAAKGKAAEAAAEARWPQVSFPAGYQDKAASCLAGLVGMSTPMLPG